ncbi:hypothetical protein [Wielerella bovis]|uniref:hypothetical protein n=1 Tax=Wielerella bovis TaxID=2917790 RepID=UPI00201998E8|nr:hypothetical protein [Wielerella bovis]ULJ59930.1 hypothetical protein MIS44_09675 [Wielerella bovis]
MAIYAFGANYDDYDVSQEFIDNAIVGFGWNETEAPDLHNFISTLKVGDIVYIKSFSPSSSDLIIKAIGIIPNNKVKAIPELVSAGIDVNWIKTDEFRVLKPKGKNNVRLNSMYEEFHPEIQKIILEKLFQAA